MPDPHPDITSLDAIVARLHELRAIEYKLRVIKTGVLNEYQVTNSRITMYYRRRLAPQFTRVDQRKALLAAVREARNSNPYYIAARERYLYKVGLVNARLAPVMHERRLLRAQRKVLQSHGFR